ncbi:acetyl-CoA synthetase-like protein [Gigaspora margarita]|uniref:Acetyl-CoA synthetase-like protein n=1 Tax=Gigaspora margarita TaxID=4874 RepID=A0A8H4ALH5_GIGMA|nr:acetyl-CoA synthetase-like protein [Gigaspora margarita]
MRFGPQVYRSGALFPYLWIDRSCFVYCLYRGTTVVIPKFDIKNFYSCIQKYKISFIHGVPPIVLALAKYPDLKYYDISSLRMILSAAAPLGKESSEEFHKILKIPIKQGSGLTETSLVINLSSSDNIVAGSVGDLVPNVEAKIVPVKGLELGPTEGEICVRGPNIMKSYLNNDEATKDSFDEAEFFHTGDIARVDDNCN